MTRAEAEIKQYRDLMRAYGRQAVFVFGSNVQGIHGAGAAREAALWYGAEDGKGEGHAGRSYAIPTRAIRGHALVTLSLAEIGAHVARFRDYAESQMLDHVFIVTRVGCGLAGYTDDDIAPLFAGAPENCLLPEGWRARNGEPC